MIEPCLRLAVRLVGQLHPLRIFENTRKRQLPLRVVGGLVLEFTLFDGLVREIIDLGNLLLRQRRKCEPLRGIDLDAMAQGRTSMRSALGLTTTPWADARS